MAAAIAVNENEAVWQFANRPVCQHLQMLIRRRRYISMTYLSRRPIVLKW